MPYPVHDTSVYEQEVDPSAPNHAHSYALAMVGHNKRVLELGCTAGHFTRALVRQSCSVVGVEIDPSAAVRAADVAERVVPADLDDPRALEDLAEGEFDVVTAGDVLEHLRDPLTVLRTCRRLLRPAGFLVASVPNVAHADVRLTLLGGDFPYQPAGLLDTTHLRFFTRRSLDELLWAAGFIPVEVQRVVMPIFTTELAVDQAKVPPELVARILGDGEAEAYQFVVKAVIDDGRASVQAMSRRLSGMDSELRRREAEARSMANRLHEAQQATSELSARLEEAGGVARTAEDRAARAEDRAGNAEDRAGNAEDRAARAEIRASQAEAQVAALQQLRSMRYSAPLRRVYGRLRAALLRRRGR